MDSVFLVSSFISEEGSITSGFSSTGLEEGTGSFGGSGIIGVDSFPKLFPKKFSFVSRTRAS